MTDAEPDWPQEIIDVVASDAGRLVEIVGREMRAAFDAGDPGVRRSHSVTARANIERLKDFAADYPFLKIEHLPEVLADLDKIDARTVELEGAADPLLGILPKCFDTQCDCGREFGVELAVIDQDFSCPECGEVGKFSQEQVAAIRSVMDEALTKARKSMFGLGGAV